MQTTTRKTKIAAFLADPFLRQCSHGDLKRIRKAASDQIKARYVYKSSKKYGGLNRSFTDKELDNFFDNCKNVKARHCFLLQRYLGLRIGEVVRLRIDKLDMPNRRLYVDTEKAQQPDCLYLHPDAYTTICSWLAVRGDNTSPYLFPGTRDGHASEHWLGNHFRYTMERAALETTYAMSLPCGALRMPRPLNRLTTHSFRHYFIRRCWYATRDQMLVMRLARHRKFQSTETYLQVQQETLDDGICKAFRSALPIAGPLPHEVESYA